MRLQTIIECLKQATTGELPPNTRSGQSFIHDPKASPPWSQVHPHHLKSFLKCHNIPCKRPESFLWACSVMGRSVLQIAGDSEVKAQIKLRINTATSQPVVIIRSFQVRLKLAAWFQDGTWNSCALSSTLAARVHQQFSLMRLSRAVLPQEASGRVYTGVVVSKEQPYLGYEATHNCIVD